MPPRQNPFRPLTVAMCRHVGEASVPIVVGAGGPIGSGTLFTVVGRYFVSTAAHVIMDEQLDDLEIPVTTRPSNLRALLKGYGWRGGGPRDPVDVGWIEIQQATARPMDRRFLHIDRMRLRVAHDGSDAAFVLGFPGTEIEKPRSPEEGVLRSTGVGYCTATLGEGALGARFKPAFDTYLAYPDLSYDQVDEGWLKRAPDAPGMSGGSIWLLGQLEGAVWDPSMARMVAIDQSWLRGEWLRGTKVQHWLRMLIDDVAEVRAAVLSVFPALLDGP
jgi:hypothetical protein